MTSSSGRLPAALQAARPRVKHAVKVAAAGVLWSRVAARTTAGRLTGWGVSPGRPEARPSGVLRDRAEWERSTAQMRALRLPTHPDGSKNWDTLAALSTTLAYTRPGEHVLDAGAALYSTYLPSLRLYGYNTLVGTNLEFGRTLRAGGVRLEHGDIEASGFATESFAAVACLSVIEHGVDVPAFLAESARILRPGGVLVVSTDYWDEGIDTGRLSAYGTPVRIFDRPAVEQLLRTAETLGLQLLGGPVDLRCTERAVHWRRLGLDYTYVVLAWRKR